MLKYGATLVGLCLQLSLKNNSRSFCLFDFLFSVKRKRCPTIQLSSALDLNWMSPGVRDARRFPFGMMDCLYAVFFVVPSTKEWHVFWSTVNFMFFLEILLNVINSQDVSLAYCQQEVQPLGMFVLKAM